MKTFLKYCVRKIASLRSDNDGFVVMLTLSLFLLLFVFCASIYAVGETIHQKIRLQNACDAAAYSAAVVQADGLSRMATVNQALEWSYVQMSNREMDYITYLWLQLTVNRYVEDRNGAKGHHAFLVASFDPSLGIFTLITMIFDLAVDRLVGYWCPYLELRCNGGHNKQGKGWWSGQGPSGQDYIKLNGHGAGEFKHVNTIADVLASITGVAASIVPPEPDEPDEPDDPDVPDTPEPVEHQELADIIGNPNPPASDPDDPDAPPYDPYGLNYDQESGEDPLEHLNAWYQNSKQKIDNAVDDQYRDQIEQETDPDEIEKLEQERDEKKQALYADLDDVYNGYLAEYEKEKKINEINEYYQNLIDAIPVPEDPSDDAQRDAYYEQVQAIEAQRDAEIANVTGTGTADAGDSGTGSSIIPGEIVNFVPMNPWIEQMQAQIRADKETIKLLNEALPAINLGLHSTMKTVAEFVLVQMLRDPRLPDDQALKKYHAYISIPRGLDPYAATSETDEGDEQQILAGITGGGVAENFYSPIFNTEPNERLFLQFGSPGNASGNLCDKFPLAKPQESGNNKGGWGLDQWYVRTSEKEDENGVRQRTEGAFGLQRGYKDTNLNETNAGIFFMKNSKIDRGNHITNLVQDRTMGGDINYDSISGFIRSVLETILKPIVDGLAGEFCDLTPSCGNARSQSSFIPMCSNVSQGASLYSEYEWASGKWLCLARAKSLYWDYAFCQKFHKVWCNWGKIPRKKRHRRWFDKKHFGYGHYHFPKWFCGEKPRFLYEAIYETENPGSMVPFLPSWFASYLNFCAKAQSLIRGSVAEVVLSGDPKKNYFVQALLLDMFPPIFGDIHGGNHGYMENTMDIEALITKLGPQLLNHHKSIKRDEYKSCVTFIDGMFTGGLNCATEDGRAAMLVGHARIYGDDEEIWDPNYYVGETVKPWLLNERFFSGGGTIVVGAALKHENPFVQMFSMLNAKNGIDNKSVLSAFDPPTYKDLKLFGNRIPAGNYIWTMSAARAGVRRVRRDGPFDRERMYQVSYDPTSDPENFRFHSGSTPYRIVGETIYSDPNDTTSTISDVSYSWQEYKEELSRHDHDAIIGGCICADSELPSDHPANRTRTAQLENVWNLCEQDWDATLLPLRYAGRSARLEGFSPNATHDERVSVLENMNLKVDVGKGSSWVWEPALNGDSAGNINPMNPADPDHTGWSPLDEDDQLTDPLKLDSLLPDGVNKLNLQRLLRQNRIL